MWNTLVSLQWSLLYPQARSHVFRGDRFRQLSIIQTCPLWKAWEWDYSETIDDIIQEANLSHWSPPDPDLSAKEADWLSTFFDVGGILGESLLLSWRSYQPAHLHLLGGIVVGLVSDWLRARAVVCVIALLLAIPSVSQLVLSCSSIIPVRFFQYFISSLLLS